MKLDKLDAADLVHIVTSQQVTNMQCRGGLWCGVFTMWHASMTSKASLIHKVVVLKWGLCCVGPIYQHLKWLPPGHLYTSTYYEKGKCRLHNVMGIRKAWRW